MFCLVVIGVGVCCRGADNEGSRKSSGCRNGGADAIGEYRVCGYHDWGHD